MRPRGADATKIGDKMCGRGIISIVTISSLLPIIAVGRLKMVGVVVKTIQEHAINPTIYNVGSARFLQLPLITTQHFAWESAELRNQRNTTESPLHSLSFKRFLLPVIRNSSFDVLIHLAYR
jgi:hypothetical protein